MSVAIIFIGTNKYFSFFEDYYSSVKANFLRDTQKHFFVFTDSENIDSSEDITKIQIEHEKWPFITLNRYKIIKSISDKLEKYDYTVYIDADMIAESTVSEDEFFTTAGEKKYFGVQHPGYVNSIGTFETNNQSLAFVDFNTEDYSVYYQGCFWGGKTCFVLNLCEVLHSRIEQDLKNNIIAIWHDESHLNKYFIENKKDVALFHPGYAYPSNWNMPYEKKIVHLVKDNQTLHV